MNTDESLRMVRLARSYEHGEIYYNAAKLALATLFSDQVSHSNDQGLLTGDELVEETARATASLRAAGAPADVISAWEATVEKLAAKGYLSLKEVPEIRVCRACGRMMFGPTPLRCPSCGAHRFTFRDFPVPWWPEPFTPAEALSALRSAPAEIREAIGDMDDKAMSIAPAAGEWSVRDVIAHLLFSERAVRARIDLIRDVDDPPLENMVVGQQAENAAVGAWDLFRIYSEARADTVAMLEHLPVESWLREGHHGGIGAKTILHQASYFTKHERVHVPHIEKIKAAIAAHKGI